MAYIDTDLELVKETGIAVVNNMAEAQILLDKFYSRLTGITETKEWEGNNVRPYCNKVGYDKKDYTEFLNGMKELGKKMVDFAEKTDDEVRRIERHSNK